MKKTILFLLVCCLCLVLMFGCGQKDDTTAAGNSDALCGEYWENDSNPTEAVTTEAPVINDEAFEVLTFEGRAYKKFAINPEGYTTDSNLGAVNDFDSGITGEIYTTLEDPNVLILLLADGSTIGLRVEAQ